MSKPPSRHPEPTPDERKAAILAEREAVEADRAREYAEARERIEALNAAKDRDRAKADGRAKPASPTEALGTANALIDSARLNPTDRNLASRALEAAAVAGLVQRGVCFACRAADAHAFPIPGADVLAGDWMCDPCARGKGTARG